MSLNAPSPEEAHSVSSLRELMETTTAATTTSASDIKPPSRPSSVIPSILASLAATSPANIQSKQHELSPQNEGEREHEHMATKSATQTPTHHHHRHQLATTTTTPPRSNTRSSSPAYEIPHSASPHSERSSSGSNSAGAPQQFCLRWNNYQSNLTSVFDQLLQTESFVDVTLACDGRSIKAHKMVLSACSPYFQSLFSDIPCQHPIVIMKDVGWLELKTIVDFMYKGEINVSQEQIGPLLRIAEMLKVRGLADVGNIETATSSMRNARETPRTKRQRSHTPPAKHHAQEFDGDHRIAAKDFLFFAEPDKKQHIEKAPIWNIDADASSRAATMATNNPNASAVELSLSPLPLPTPHANLLTRNVRKRRWTSADALFNPTASPLSGLIAAERAEQEQERARQRERECERLLLTPPIPTIASAGMTSSHHMTGCKTHPTSTSSAGPSTQSVNPMEISSRSSPTQSSSVLLPPARTPTGMLTPSPHLQLPHSLQHSTGHHSQQTSPALSVASTQPSSVFSSGGGGGGSHLTPSPANITSGTSSSAGESHRFSMGSAQAAAMAAAAAAAHIDLTPSPHGGLSMGPHPPPSVPIGGVATHHHHPPSIADDLEIKPGIAEMIREEERAKMLENTHAWMSSGPSIADSYQYQLQSMWQKCWNTNQSLMHHLRFRERGPLKSWRPETMAEAIFSVLKEGLSLSQAARKYDIPYPTFVLYANRVHNMLGPSIDGGPDLRPKGRGRPQRILLGIWPDEHIKGVIKTVVFRDAKDLKEETFTHLPYGRHSPVFPFQDGTLGYGGPGSQCANGIPTPTGDQMTQEATAAAVAAVAHNFRQQMQMAAAQHQHQQHTDSLGSAGLFSIPPHLTSAAAVARGAASPLTGPPGPGGLMLPKASISPALSTTSNPSGGGVVVGPRHQPSPCASALSGMHQLGPGMAAALQMVGVPGRCETATLLSQQQQHQQQLQQLHLQQQHAALHHQQQKHSHQHQQMLFGTSSLGHQSITPSAMATSSIASPQQISTTKSSSSSISSSPERMRHSMPVDIPLRSSFTEFGFDLGHNKSSPSFSPARLFPDDIAELVGVTPASRNHHQSMLLTPASITTTTTTTTTKSNTPSDITTSVSSNIATSQTTTTSTTSNKSSSSVKIEPITTTSE